MKPCPCGKTPTGFNLPGYEWEKYQTATPNCCGEWIFEFRSKSIDNAPLDVLAIRAWDALPRAGDVPVTRIVRPRIVIEEDE